MEVPAGLVAGAAATGEEGFKASVSQKLAEYAKTVAHQANQPPAPQPGAPPAPQPTHQPPGAPPPITATPPQPAPAPQPAPVTPGQPAPQPANQPPAQQQQQAPAQPPQPQPGQPPPQPDDAESLKQIAQSLQAQTQEGDAPPTQDGDQPPTPAGSVEIELPQHLHGRGMDSVTIPKEHEEVFNDLVGAAASRAELDTERNLLLQQVQQQRNELWNVVAELLTNPFAVHERVYSEQMPGTPEDAESIGHLWFLEDTDRWQRLVELVNLVEGDEQQRTAQLNIKKGVLSQRSIAAQTHISRQQAQAAVVGEIEKYAQHMVRQAVPQQLQNQTYEAICYEVNSILETYGVQALTAPVVEQVVSKWTGPYANGNQQAIDQAQQQIEQRAAQQQQARTVVPIGQPGMAPAGGPTALPPGTDLHDIAKAIQAQVVPM